MSGESPTRSRAEDRPDSRALRNLQTTVHRAASRIGRTAAGTGPVSRAACTAALVAALSVAVSTTVLVPADLPELARAATLIAYGRIVAVQARVAADTRRIEREVTFGVVDCYKGDLGRTVTFTVPGGRLGHYRTVMVGAPEFREGEEVVLFLTTTAPDALHLVGLAQGVFRVVPDTRTGQRLVVSPVLVRGGSVRGAVPIERGDPARAPLQLEAFAAEVRRAIEPGPRRSPGRER